MVCQVCFYDVVAFALGNDFKDQLNLFILQTRKVRLREET